MKRQAVKDRIPDQLERATTEFQRMVLLEWARRNPPITRHIIGTTEIVPSPCNCLKCKGGAVIIPDNSIEPARGFVLCPNCSVPQQAQATA